jgi:hypothetical protein
MAIVYDLERYLRLDDCNRTIRTLMRTMRLMAPSLRNNVKHLPSQIVGRLVNLDEDYPEDYGPPGRGIFTQLVTQAQQCKRFNWWCPKRRTLDCGAGAVTFSADGHYLASGSSIEDEDERKKNAEDKDGDYYLTSGVVSLSFSADGYLLASGSRDRTVRVWDGRLSRISARLGRISTRLGGISTRLGRISARLGRISTRLGRNRTMLGRISTR